MTKKEQFVYVVEELIKKVDVKEICNNDEIYNGFTIYFDSFKKIPEVDKPILTDNGKTVLKYMQENMESGSSKMVADGLGVSSRSTSGTMRKLAADGFLEKMGENPVIYIITNKGKEINID